jgi:hypothetical protein
MNRLALVIAFTLGTIGFAFAQAPAADDHSAHHQTQDAASAPQSEQTQQARPQTMQDCSMMPRGGGTTADATTMQAMMQTQAMMQMTQGMMQMMQSQMQSGRGPH